MKQLGQLPAYDQVSSSCRTQKPRARARRGVPLPRHFQTGSLHARKSCCRARLPAPKLPKFLISSLLVENGLKIVGEHHFPYVVLILSTHWGGYRGQNRRPSIGRQSQNS